MKNHTSKFIFAIILTGTILFSGTQKTNAQEFQFGFDLHYADPRESLKFSSTIPGLVLDSGADIGLVTHR